jgi:small subunit ribosomal protein S15
MTLTLEERQKVIAEYKINDADVGSPEVQVALLTTDINKLQGHFKDNKKDLHSRRGLMRKINLRRSLLNYLQRKSQERYASLIERLGLRR